MVVFKKQPNKNKILFYKLEKKMISESQIFIALFIALINGILAVRLGIKLY
jgi:photosystem I reaction center subunit XII